MRIDRPEPADEPDRACLDRRARSAADGPGAAGKDQGKAVGGDGPHDSSPRPLDSALRTERAAAYRAAVDAAYRQPEREMVTAPTRGIEAEDREPYPVGLVSRRQDRGQSAEAAELAKLQVPDQTIAATWSESASKEHNVRVRDDVQTGARGPASGREFDPEAAGGPIQQLDAGKARITVEDVQEVAAHLQRFTGGGSLQPPEQGMLDRLTSIAAGDIEPTSYDRNFFTHELDEASRYAKLGFGPESGVDLGTADMYDVWNDVHTATLEDYGISDADLFYPGLAP